MDEYLIGVRLRETSPADDYKLVDLFARVGELVLVESAAEPLIGEVRRPRRAVPEHKRDQLYRRVLRIATDEEAREYHDRREREKRGILTAQGLARQRNLAMKVVDVELHPTARRVTIFFGADERVDSASSSVISPASSARAWRCGRSARAIPRTTWMASARAAGSSAAARISGSSSRSP